MCFITSYARVSEACHRFVFLQKRKRRKRIKEYRVVVQQKRDTHRFFYSPLVRFDVCSAAHERMVPFNTRARAHTHLDLCELQYKLIDNYDGRGGRGRNP